MPYDRTRHQELLAKLDAGLAKVSGPQYVDDYTDSSDGAFTSMLDDVLAIIHDRLTNGCNSAVVDLLLTPANILMAGRLVEALEDRGFYCSDMRRKSEELQADYLTFEAVLLPLKPEAPAVMVDPAAPKADTTNFITPGTVVTLFSQGLFAEKTQRVVAALKEAGYEVRHVVSSMAHTYPAFQVRHRYGAPEAARIIHILGGLTNGTIYMANLSKDFAALDDYRVYLGND